MRPVVIRGSSLRCVLSTAVAVVLIGLADGMNTTAMAQGTPDSRVALDVGAAFQAKATSVTQTIAFEQYSEPGSLTSTYSASKGPIVDAGVTVRVWRHFGAGVSVDYFHDSGSAQVSAMVPNPFEFGQLRQVSGTPGVSHTEVDTHVQAAYWAQLSPRVDILVSGGPSVFRVDQDFVSDLAYTQAAPYNAATYQGASTVRERQTAVGGNVGGEIGWRVANHLNLTGSMRYSRATADFPDTSAQPLVLGGLRVGGGICLHF
jgi:hypothetical protein